MVLINVAAGIVTIKKKRLFITVIQKINSTCYLQQIESNIMYQKILNI